VPKLKTHKGAKKRIHISGSGKLMRTKGPKTHFRRNKRKDMKRLLDNKLVVDRVDIVRIARVLPGVKPSRARRTRPVVVAEKPQE